MPNNNNVLAALVEIATTFRNIMASNVSQQGLPSAIVDATSIGTPQENDKGQSIQVSIDLNTAPMAAAFEYGSGIWRTRGVPGRYPIVPRNGKFLKFEYGVGRNIPLDIPNLSAPEINYEKGTDFAFFKSVMHPGVQQKPYIRPALIEVRGTAKQKLGSAFVESITLKGITAYKVEVR